MRGAFQNRRTRSISGGVNAIWAASWLARPPTSRPPIALGCPVSENGEAPGLPIRPVARWQLRMALTLSVPCADWLTPCEYSVTARGVSREHLEEVCDIGLGKSGRQRGRDDAAGDAARPRQRVFETCGVAFDVAAVERAGIGEMHQQPANNAVSVPGFNPRNRSASPEVSVRRGSITTMRAPRACLLASMRWNSTGWHHAALEPTSTSRSAWSRSS